MPSSAKTLPVELWQMIIRNAEPEDLPQLRRVNSAFNTLATPAVFESITFLTTFESANKIWELLHTPHLAQYVRSITFVEEFNDWRLVDVIHDVVCDPSWDHIRAVFDNIHRAHALNTLALFFDPFDRAELHPNRLEVSQNICTHQWEIIQALARNGNPKLKISDWVSARHYESPYRSPSIALLAASLLHLRFSFAILQDGVQGTFWQRMLFWKEVVVEAMLKLAVKLESLEIIGFDLRAAEEQCFDLSQVPTYPRLAELSLKNVVFEVDTIDEKGIVIPSTVEDFIVRHAKTLKKLKLHNYAIEVIEGRERPLCYWADIFNRLAKALTELIELEVLFLPDSRYDMPRYVYIDDGDENEDEENTGLYRRFEDSKGRNRTNWPLRNSRQLSRTRTELPTDELT
ncbi:hypothetical protein BC827DRAFT_364379 [Russula dissimulans]|nr:hypothetical protein BC827DRAFT_364379 [Russula dissimulans]